MSTLVIRPAVEMDIDAIRQVGQETWPSTYGFAGSEYVSQGLAQWWSPEAVLRDVSQTRTFVAEMSGEVVGMGNLDLRGEKVIIWKLYVLPGHQGAGVGHALMTRLLAEVPTGEDVYLEYTEGNDRAADFYRRHGFTEFRRDDAVSPADVWMVHKAQGV